MGEVRKWWSGTVAGGEAAQDSQIEDLKSSQIRMEFPESLPAFVVPKRLQQ